MTTSFDELLESIDPAGPPDPNSHTTEHAQAALSAALADSGRTLRPSVDGTRPPKRFPAVRARMLVAVAAAAVLAGGAIIVPQIVGAQMQTAWSAVPEGVTSEHAQAAASDCAELLGQVPSSFAYGPWQASHLVLSERRGDSTFVVLAAGEQRAACVNVVGEDSDARISASSLLEADYVPAPRGGLSGAALSTTPFHESELAPADTLITLHARVGDQVRGATLEHPAFEESVTTTIDNGYLAAWVPGTSQNVDPDLFVLTLELADGSQVRLDADAIHDAGRDL